MKYTYIWGVFFFIVCSCAVESAWAQLERASKAPPPSALREVPGQDFSLTEDQQLTIRRVKANYLMKVVQLRSELAVSQLEFRGMVGDPAITEEALRNKGREVEAINGQIVREMINYEIEIRRILTPDQLKAWGRSVDYPVQKKWGKNP